MHLGADWHVVCTPFKRPARPLADGEGQSRRGLIRQPDPRCFSETVLHSGPVSRTFDSPRVFLFALNASRRPSPPRSSRVWPAPRADQREPCREPVRKPLWHGSPDPPLPQTGRSPAGIASGFSFPGDRLIQIQQHPAQSSPRRGLSGRCPRRQLRGVSRVIGGRLPGPCVISRKPPFLGLQ
jgi:hypothetical protein